MSSAPPSHQRLTPRTLVALLQRRAKTSPESGGYRYLLDGDVHGPSESLSFGVLEQQARVVGAALSRVGAPRDRALLLYPEGLAALAGFFGCLFAGMIAVPACLPEDSSWEAALPRLLAMVRDAGATVVLTTDQLRGVLEAKLGPSVLPPLRWISTDRLPEERAKAWVPPRIDGRTIALLHYGSSATSDPRGVEIAHASLLHALDDLAIGADHGEGSVVVSLSPISHELGLVHGVLRPVHGGSLCVSLSPRAFLGRPSRWLEAISFFRGTHAAAPPCAFDRCVQTIHEDERRRLDLSCVRQILNVGAPMGAGTFTRFQATCGPLGLDPLAMASSYGLAEATLKITAPSGERPARVFAAEAAALDRGEATPARDAGASRSLLGCGRPALGATIRIVDEETGDVVADRTLGEIWVSGPSVAAGYWRSPEATNARFGRRIVGERGIFLRTGDRGFLDDGELFVVDEASSEAAARERRRLRVEDEVGPALAPASASIRARA